MDGVAANPFGELAVRNQKYASNCTELHLANRNIGWLQGFDRFVNLEVLWLNDNKLRKLNGLEKNFRLRALHAHNNQLSTLKDSSVSRLVFLDELMLFNNHLEDLHATLKTLSRLRHLKHLDMFGNPLSEEKDYRLHVIKQLPHLEVLDRHVITEQERAQSVHVKPPDLVYATQGQDGRARAETGSSDVGADASAPGARGRQLAARGSAAESAVSVAEVVASIQRRVTDKRLLLKPNFLEVRERHTPRRAPRGANASHASRSPRERDGSRAHALFSRHFRLTHGVRSA